MQKIKSIRKFTSVVLAFLIAFSCVVVGISAASANEGAVGASSKVQFTNNQHWNSVYAYAWTSNETPTLGDWPGTPMTKLGDNGMGSDNYQITVPANTAYIIFTDGQNQTVDIPCQTGKGYYPTTQTNGNWNVGTWDLADEPTETTVAVETTQPVQPPVGETTTKAATTSSRVVFTNNQNWSSVYAYAWTSSEQPTLGDWPGTPMTKIGDNGRGSDNYQITVPANTAYIIFTDGQNQTVDIPCQTGKGYYPTNQTNGNWNVGTWDLGDDPVETTVEETTTTPVELSDTPVYFRPNSSWATGNVKYAMYSHVFHAAGSGWTELTPQGDGTYIGYPVKYAYYVYFARFDANTTDYSFDNALNQTSGLHPYSGKVFALYDDSLTDGEWLDYTPQETTTQAPTTSSRVVFTNNQNWSSVYAYAWTSSEQPTLGDWPGTPMTKIGDNGRGSDNYQITVPANTAYIIFTDGQNQTVDIPCQTGKGYYPTNQTNGKWNVGTWDLGDTPEPPVVETTTQPVQPPVVETTTKAATTSSRVVFTNNQNWSSVYAYAWTSSEQPTLGDWPGTPMTKIGDNGRGSDNYQITVPANTAYIIFTDGQNQTVDIPCQTGKGYYPTNQTNGKWNVGTWDLGDTPEPPVVETTTQPVQPPVVETTTKAATTSSRVVFTNNQNWSSVYAYAWTSSEQPTLGDWPGTPMTKIGDNGRGSDNYQITVPANTAYIIFTDGQNQTVDIPCQTGKGYYPTNQTNGKWNVGTWDLGDTPEPPVVETTTQPVQPPVVETTTKAATTSSRVVFTNNQNWSSVYAYAWTSSEQPTLGDWPGTPMTKIGDNGRGSDNYQITVPANTAYIIFTDGQNQTVDIPCQTGKGYYPTNQTNGKWNVGTWDLGDTPEPPVVETTTQPVQPPVVETTTKAATTSSRVVFTNNQNWSSVYAYAWTSSEQPTLGDWPGTPMTKIGDNGRGSDNYQITVPANTAYIIFTDGQNQTVDIPCQTGKGYYPTNQTNGKWNVGTWDLGDTPEPPVVETTTQPVQPPVVETTTKAATTSSRVVFTNNQNWSSVYAYAWTSSEQPTLGDWPGTPMTKIGDNGRGSDNYQITVPANTAYIIFTDGQNQTVDIPCQTGKGYYPTNQTNGKWNVGTWDLGDTPEPPVVETTTQPVQPPVVETTTKAATTSSRVVFTNNQNWSSVYAYAWTSSEQPTLGDWPGTPMTKIGDNGRGSDNYQITVPANTAYIIFTDGQNQTVDIPCQTGKGYYPTNQTNGKWNVGTWDLGDTPEPPVVETTTQPVQPPVVETTTKAATTSSRVVFTNNQHWNTVYAYAWTSSEQPTLGQWPGTPMTKIGDNGRGSDNYQITVPANTAYIIFTDGQNQTVDIPCQTGKGYYPTTQTNGKWNVGTWDLEVQPGTEQTTTDQGQVELTDPEITEQTTTPVASEIYDPSRTVRTYSISLADAIGMTFRVLTNTVADLDNPYVVVEMNGQETVIDTYTEDTSRGEYLFKFNKIYPQNLGDEVKATVYGMKNGVLYYGPEYTKTVKGYVENQLAKPAVAGNVPMRKLLVSLLNYGAETQLYSGYHTDNLATSGLTNEQKSWGETEYGTLVNVKNYNYETYPGTTCTWKSASLVLGSTVQIKTRFTASDASSKKIRVEINGAYEDFGPENIVDEGNGTYSFSYAGVYANSMNDTVKFTVMEQGKPVSSTMTYSIASYASNYINSSQYPALASLLRAMMCYGKAAESFG